jgi:hypothetical protein
MRSIAILTALVALSHGTAAAPSTTATVRTVNELIERLGDNHVDRIVVADGHYALDTNALNVSRSVSIEADTPGNVVIDAGAETSGIRGAVVIDPSTMSDTVTLVGLNLTGAYVIDDGGGVDIRRGNVELTRCNIYLNTAMRGGGITVGGGAFVTLNSCSIFSNTAQHGGGVFVIDGNVVLNECDVHSNKAYQGTGGGIMISNGTVMIKQGSVYANNADVDGGGVYVEDGTVSLDRCDIHMNYADTAYGIEVCAPLDCAASSFARRALLPTISANPMTSLLPLL